MFRDNPVRRSRTTQRPLFAAQSSRLVLVLLLCGVAALLGVPAASAQQEQGGRFYPQTGFTMAPEFISYYDAHGGLALFGYPITAPQQENGLLVQYFERERFEYHPEYRGSDAEVLLGRLGAELTDGRADGAFQPLNPGTIILTDRTFMAPTGHTLGGYFSAYWQARGGLVIFGYPISEEFEEDGVLQQWFERARFEMHPELPREFIVSLGLLGREALDESPLPQAEITVAAGPAQPRHLKVDLAQGGESGDPTFLHNVVPQLQALKLSLIRIDNIYTHFNVIGRARGGLTYDWSRLDPVVDDILATGAKPFFNLSYMPPILSGVDDNIHPPQSLDDWNQVASATARHFNVDRNAGIKYWEMWNEPDQWNAWRGSFLDYLNLYDAGRRGVRGVDNNAVVGGPSLSHFDASALDWLAGFQPYTSDGGYVGFVSWHAFGVTPAALADQVRDAKNVIAKHPGWNPEIIVDELNVKTGGANDTSEGNLSDTSAAAAHILASLDTLEKAGADRAMIFEAKDGERQGQEFWGRWGILTYNGLRKPSYHALQAYQSLGPDLLPTAVQGCDACGLLASPTANGARLILWNNGPDAMRIHINLPPALAGFDYTVNVLDSHHNNPRNGDSDALTASGVRTGSGLTFAVEGQSVIILNGE